MSAIEEMLQNLPPGQAVLRLETVVSGKPRHGDQADDETGDAAASCSKEQFLNVTITLPDLGNLTQQQETIHLILVVDKSGSMSGNPWKQVQHSLKDIIGRSIGQPNLKLDLIVYNTNAHFVELKSTTYQQTIDDIKAGGMTDFLKAFAKVNRLITEADKPYSQTVVVFMTDGNDTVNEKGQLQKLGEKMAERFRELGKTGVIHSVGFTSGHDFKFLKNLSESGGTTPGMFRYCEPGEDKEALQKKLDELVNFVLLNDESGSVEVTVSGAGNYMLNTADQSRTSVLPGRQCDPDPEKQAGAGKQDPAVCTDAWIYLEDPEKTPEFTVTVRVKLNLNETTREIQIPCLVDSVEHIKLESDNDKSAWRLRILARNVDDLIEKAGKAISEKGDVKHLQERVEKHQKQISNTRIYGNGITKEGREAMFDIIKEIQGNLDQIQGMLAEYLRSGTDSISLLARAHDMRYQAVFNKSRRQRTMDKRATKNMMHATEAQQKLSSLVVDEQEVKQLSQDALGFFFCILSQNSVQDVLLGDDKDDAIGFGLAVKRNEVVLDEPTLIKLQVISGTLVSRVAMLDALEYKINVSSHLSAHGGFSFDRDSALGVTTVGAGREPINAWLPLYITRSHWDRVKVILKPALGSFCMLDPLGYDYKQMDVPFMVLGAMIGQLTDRNAGEHQLRLLFALQRTCAACVQDFNLEDDIVLVLENFLKSPEGRTKDILVHLSTLIGYIVSIPTTRARQLFKMEDSDDVLNQFWMGYIAEWIRRATGSLCREKSSVETNGMLDVLLHGPNTVTIQTNTGIAESIGCRGTAELLRLCLDRTAGQGDLHIDPFDPTQGVKAIELEKKHDMKIDRAMETWAESESGFRKNLVKSKKYHDALKVVQQWEAEGMAGVGAEMDSLCIESPASDTARAQEQANSSSSASSPRAEASTDGDGEAVTEEENDLGFDCSFMSQPIVEITAQLHNVICSSAMPGIQSLPGSIAFLRYWLAREHDLSDLDRNSGLAPEGWVREVKEVVRTVYREMTDYTEGEKEVLTVVGEVSTSGQQTTLTGSAQTVTGSGQTVSQNTTSESETTSQVTATPVTARIADKADDESESDLDEEFDDDFEDDTDDEMAALARRQVTKTQKASKRARPLCLPMILHCVDKCGDSVMMTRAMLCQAIRFHSNSAARTASANGLLLDLGKAGKACEVLQGCHQSLVEFQDQIRRGLIDRALWKRANYCMLHASTSWAFVGYLMRTHKSRLEGFSDLVDLFMSSVNNGVVPPYMEEKIHIMLTGKHQDCPVLDNGNQWLPEKKMATKFEDMLGEETWRKFEVELRSCVQVHVYRASDIPNRHGHCNSNPYIPNALRKKLGMKLLPETKHTPGKQRALRRHQH